MVQKAAESLETDESDFCRIAAVRAAEKELDMNIDQFQRVRKKELKPPGKPDGHSSRPNGHPN